MKKFLLFILLLIVILGMGVGGGLYAYFRFSYFPDYNGEITVPGIEADVRILRDQYGIPYIFAQNPRDAFFAQGFVEAQDRPLQLEVFRRAARGQLSEILGESFLDMDRFTRLAGFQRIAEDIVDNMDDEARSYMESYVMGINAGFRSLGPNLPIEFRALGITPANWDIYDPVAFSRIISWGNSADYTTEYFMMKLVEKLGEEKAMQLLPYSPEPQGGVVSLPELPLLEAGSKLVDLLGVRISCINWAISGEKSTSGKAMLVFDAHQREPRTPSEVYLMRIYGGEELDVAGSAIIGVPGTYSGISPNISWGMTNVRADNQDLYREKINPKNPDLYLYKDEWHKMEIVEEQICFKNKKSDTGMTCETFRARYTVHGPVISDTFKDYEGGEEVLAVRWSGFEEGLELSGYIEMNFARTWEEFRKALDKFGHAPQHYTYADANGNIGYQVGGMVPMREKNVPPPLPARGWLGENEWLRLLTLDELPHVYNPADGFIASANHRPINSMEPHYIGREFAPPERHDRIVHLLSLKKKVSIEDVLEQHNDVYNLVAEKTVPAILASLKTSQDPAHMELATILSNWNYNMDADAAAPAVFESIFMFFIEETFKDELGEELTEEYMDRRYMMLERFLLIMNDRYSKWFDDTQTDNSVESRKEIILRAASLAHMFLVERMGDNTAKWRWGDIHQVTLPHYASDIVNIMDIGPFPQNGGNETVNRNGFSYKNPFAVERIAILRLVADFNDPGHVKAIIPTGQSGWWLHPNYQDQTPLWLEGGLISIPRDRKEAEDIAKDRLLLSPM